MFLARRETGKALRVYPVDTTETEPRAWTFNCCVNQEKGFLTQGALSAGSTGGVSATGRTRGEAIENLQTAEEIAQYA